MLPNWCKPFRILVVLACAMLFTCMLRYTHSQQIEITTASDSSCEQHSKLLRVSLDKIYAPHAAHYDSTPTPDRSGTCVHVDVCQAEEGWNGYRYWMTFAPYQTVEQENPNVLVSNDGRNWSVPFGLTNPIDSVENASYDRHLSDPDLLLDSDRKLWVFYRMVEKGKNENRELILVKSSKDGTTWSTGDTILDSRTEGYLSPSLVAETGHYTMWYVDEQAEPNELHKRTCNIPNGAWSEPTVCNIRAPSDLDIWHIDVTKIEDQYYALVVTTFFSGAGGTGELWLAVSSDGNNWTLGNHPLLEGTKVVSEWDAASVYRSSGIWLKNEGKMRHALWYVGKNSIGKHHLGYTELIFGAEEGVFQGFIWRVNNPRNSITASNTPWDYRDPILLKIENRSWQEHQFDTLIFSGVVPSDGLPKIFHSNYMKIDSVCFGFKTLSAETLVSGFRFRIFKQRFWNGDTLSLYSNNEKRASASADSWESFSLPGDSVGLVSPRDILSFWFISNTDTNQNVTVKTPRLYYRRQVF